VGGDHSLCLSATCAGIRLWNCVSASSSPLQLRLQLHTLHRLHQRPRHHHPPSLATRHPSTLTIQPHTTNHPSQPPPSRHLSQTTAHNHTISQVHPQAAAAAGDEVESRADRTAVGRRARGERVDGAGVEHRRRGPHIWTRHWRGNVRTDPLAPPAVPTRMRPMQHPHERVQRCL
jgi:hypothetical protein